jgi:Coenzyme PQQ synthesis protein D (PqqD)
VLGAQAKIRRNPQVIVRELSEGEGAVLLHLESGAYHGVNPVGELIWELLEEERTVADLVEAVRNRTEDPPATLEDDVVRFLESVQERDLLVVSE